MDNHSEKTSSIHFSVHKTDYKLAEDVKYSEKDRKRQVALTDAEDYKRMRRKKSLENSNNNSSSNNNNNNNNNNHIFKHRIDPLFSLTSSTPLQQKTLQALERMPLLLSQFDSLPSHSKTEALYELMRRSNTPTLQFINSLIIPILKRDFLSSLPHELALQVIGYLDILSLCRASTVCRRWNTIISRDDRTWLRLLHKDGFKLDRNTCVTISTRHDSSHYKEKYKRQYILKTNWKKGRFKKTVFSGHENHTVTCLQFDEEKIISSASDTFINVYETQNPKNIYQLQGHQGGVWALQYVNNTLVSGSTDRTVRVWNIKKRKCTHIFKGHNSTVRCLQIVLPTMVLGVLEPSEPLIVTGSRDSTIRVWRLPDTDGEEFNGEEEDNKWFKFLLEGHTESVRSIAAHGNTLVSGSYDNSVAIWNLETGRLVHRMERHSGYVYAVAIDPVRQHCMSGSMDSTVYIWDIVTGACLYKLDGHSVLVGLLGLSPKHLVSAAADKTLRVWNPDTGVCEHALAGLNGHVSAITCFKHDDEKVISGSEGGLKMWDIKTGRYLYDLISDVKGVWWVTFDYRRCIAAVNDNETTSFVMLDFGVHGLENESV